MTRQKPVYLYDDKMKFIKKFETTQECADFFGKEKEYINHNLCYCSKIRKDNQWFVILRKNIENE